MATAKQLAWRKKFAAMAKAGTLRKGKRKARRAKKRADNPGAVAHRSVWAKKARVKLRRSRRVRKANPIAVSGFAVSIGVAGNKMHKIASFRDKSRAIQYAKALHRQTGRRVSVSH